MQDPSDSFVVYLLTKILGRTHKQRIEVHFNIRYLDVLLEREKQMVILICEGSLITDQHHKKFAANHAQSS